MQQTLAIIKPDAVAAGNGGKILAHLEQKGFRIVALAKRTLSREQAAAFYAVHRERPFYDSLVDFMTEGPVIPVVLEREDAVPFLRQTMGATNPAEAEAGTLRDLFGASIERNAIHGSDSAENVAIETSFFFSQADRISGS